MDPLILPSIDLKSTNSSMRFVGVFGTDEMPETPTEETVVLHSPSDQHAISRDPCCQVRPCCLPRYTLKKCLFDLRLVAQAK